MQAIRPRRTRNDPEFELVDTGVFDEDRYFDVELTYAKAGPHDICLRIDCTNRTYRRLVHQRARCDRRGSAGRTLAGDGVDDAGIGEAHVVGVAQYLGRTQRAVLVLPSCRAKGAVVHRGQKRLELA